MVETERMIQKYIMEENFPGEDLDELTGPALLIGGGVPNSLWMLKLVAFFEERFNIEVTAHEANVEKCNTIELIAKLSAWEAGIRSIGASVASQPLLKE